METAPDLAASEQHAFVSEVIGGARRAAVVAHPSVVALPLAWQRFKQHDAHHAHGS
jgi:hypothetical protein